jgi:hypothetical protein
VKVIQHSALSTDSRTLFCPPHAGTAEPEDDPVLPHRGALGRLGKLELVARVAPNETERMPDGEGISGRASVSCVVTMNHRDAVG